MMKFKTIFIILVAAAIVPGFHLSGILDSGTAYAQVKQIDEQAGKVRGEDKTFPIEEQKKEKIQLPAMSKTYPPENSPPLSRFFGKPTTQNR